MGRLMGVDYGKRRVGIALSDEDKQMAFPREVLENGKTAELVSKIVEICKERNVDGIVFGESKDLSGKPNEIMGEIKKFKETLERETSIPTYFEPEYFTSHQAQHIQGVNKMIDASAATIILQSFIDSNKNGRKN